jgi:alkylation response protein AidB-like acyl-CoA dehydrogenase
MRPKLRCESPRARSRSTAPTGSVASFPVELHFRNARMMTIPDGTSEIQKLIIGRNLIGLAAF